MIVLILSHIDYGIIFVGMFSKVSFGKITKVTKSLCPFNTKRRYFDTFFILLSCLRWQSVVQRVQYEFRIWMYKVINNKMPKYIKDIVYYRPINVYTRYATTCPLFIKKHKTEYFKRSFLLSRLHYMECITPFFTCIKLTRFI